MDWKRRKHQGTHLPADDFGTAENPHRAHMVYGVLVGFRPEIFEFSQYLLATLSVADSKLHSNTLEQEELNLSIAFVLRSLISEEVC